MVQIIPAILSKSEEEYIQVVNKLKAAGSFKEGWVHIDFMDNKFVQNLSIEPEIIKKYPLNLKKEAHLMVEKPDDWIDRLVEAGFERILLHIESKGDIKSIITNIKEKGLDVGLVFNHTTEVEKLTVFVDSIDMVVLMGVEPGGQGREFIPESIEKVREVKSKFHGLKIGVDGGVDFTVAKDLVVAGADYLMIGSHLLEGDIDINAEKIWENIQG